MGALILGITILISLIFFIRWYSRASLGVIWRVLKWGGILLALLIGGFLLLKGGLHYIWVTAAFLVPWLLRIRRLRSWAQAAKSRTSGQSSKVVTRFIEMELDHDTGNMEGEVLEGPYRGRRLSDLDLKSLLDLLELAQKEDPQSAQILESYLDRIHGHDWRECTNSERTSYRDSKNSAARQGQMSTEEAFQILGLKPDSSKDEIKIAHRNLIREYHPDKGGSDYLASIINEAKDLLLKE